MPHQGVTALYFLQERCPNVRVVKPLNTTVFSGQKWVFQLDSALAHKAKATQEWLQRNVPAFISVEDWPSGSPDLNPLGMYIVGCFGGHGLPKASQQLGQSEEIPRESSGRDPPGDGACHVQSGRSVSRLASRQRAAILSGIIIKKNLKLLQINYLTRRVSVLFHFPSRSQYTWNRTYGRTVSAL